MQELLHQLQPFIIGAITVILGFIGKQFNMYVKAYTTEKEREQMLTIIKASVQFVEQVGLDFNANDKFLLAKNQAQKALNNVGIEVDEQDLEMWIESFVNNLKGDE